jgi:hypothetical protein
MTFACLGLILNACEQPMPTESTAAGRDQERPKASRTAENTQIEIQGMMSKTLDVIAEVIRNPKHPFRKVDHQPKKALKHRYERRKIKAFLHLSDLQTEEAV